METPEEAVARFQYSEAHYGDWPPIADHAPRFTELDDGRIVDNDKLTARVDAISDAHGANPWTADVEPMWDEMGRPYCKVIVWGRDGRHVERIDTDDILA